MELPATRSIGIAGLGLIGGSLLQALSAHAPGLRRLGFDPDLRTAAAVDASGLLHARLPSLDALLDEAELVVLCQPLAVLLQEMPALAQRVAWPVMCDVGSVKVPVLQAAAALSGAQGRFVGAHPIAGKAASGWTAAEPGLFHDRLVVLCPGAAEPAAVAQVRALWQLVGACTVEMEAERHDMVYAALSHLPQVLTWAYLAALADQPGLADAATLAGPGFASFTRLGRSDPALWAGIALQNRGPLLHGLDRLDSSLSELRHALQHNDTQALQALFSRARGCHLLTPA